jgi:hypothetical protein
VNGRQSLALRVAAVISGIVGLLPVSSAWARPYVQLGPADAMAFDQPRVTFALEDPDNPGVAVGPCEWFNQTILDTGANGILLAALAYMDEDLNLRPDMYRVQTRVDNSLVHYLEQGVAGSEALDVLVPYHLNFWESDGTGHFLPNLRAMGSVNVDLGDLPGVVGMPAMANQIVKLDLRPMVEPEYLDVKFLSSLPPGTGHSYHVALPMLPPEYPGQERPGDPLPTYAALPLIEAVTTGKRTATSSDTVLLDTGAQLSMISTQTAERLGLDLDPNSPTTDVVEILPIGGIGGSVEAPFVILDKLVIPTAEGIDLILTDLEVGVVDIPGIGGIFGMNILTSGYFEAFLEGTGYGYIEEVVLDFTGTGGVMRLDMNPVFDVVVPEPGMIGLGGIAVVALLVRRRS